ncbi:hypothetical protein N431DRAFT_479022 [Stipitochalara longipes BDJ]|nr:hypothetical protein N431DRAFT_479022 [Stipitochalara longipes BDJ]
MSPRVTLNERRGLEDSGPNCEPDNVRCGVEIIRRSNPKDPILRWYILADPLEELEYVLRKEGKLDFDRAAAVARAWLRYERDLLLAVIRSHPYYQDHLNEGKLKIEQECIKLFDRRFNFEVGRIVGVKLRQYPQNCQNKGLRLGGTLATLVLRGLDVGTYDDVELHKANTETWEALVL